ncbi:MAG: hypothetical protein J7K22_00160 [Nanoarchaeota archaeon]|nr:hypothetical protein [Nanoarchaeota archaeon]
MITEKEALKLFEIERRRLGLEENISLEFRDYKSWIAATFLNKRIIRLNRNILKKGWARKNGIDNHRKFLRRVIKHELMHIKTKSKWHNPRYFWDLM